MKEKKQKELNPKIEDKTNIEFNDEEIINKLEQSNLINIQKDSSSDESDNFFRRVITEMLNDNNISLKTEYLNANEVFTGVKLEFLAKKGNMPYLKDFVQIFETKRVSLERKSRIELIKAFEKRDEDLNAQNRMNALKGFLGV